MTPWGQDIAAITARAVASALKEANYDGKVQAEWLCQRADCLYAVKGWKNWSGRQRCQGCFKPKHQATNPPSAERLQKPGLTDAQKLEAEKTKLEKKKEKKERIRLARKERKAKAIANKTEENPKVPEAPAPTPASPGDPPPQESAPPPAATRRLALSKEVADCTNLDAIVAEIAASLKAEITPKESGGRTAKDTFIKFLGGKGPTAKSSRRQELFEATEKLKQALVPLKAGGEPLQAAAAEIEKRIADNETELSKMSKAAPTQDFELKSVTEAKAHYEVFIQSRLDRESNGANAARGRGEARAALILKLKENVQKLETEMTAEVKANSDKHAAKAAAEKLHDAEVLKLFDDKLAELGKAPPAPEASPALQIVDLESKDAMIKKIADMEREVASYKAMVKWAEPEIASEFERRADISELDIPLPVMPAKEHLSAYGKLYNTLKPWSKAGAVDPFDWKTLHTKGTDAGGITAPAIVKVLLGDLWEKWFKDVPLPSHIVPRQVAQIAYDCLCAIKIEYESADMEDEVLSEAKNAYAAIVEVGKKRRVATSA